ncbi:MAG: alkaline phosphatase family protein, partial [Proteobacteria bacterium]|nr:alkaline phosphatase family protein [Pseudomonadota bacterium]
MLALLGLAAAVGCGGSGTSSRPRATAPRTLPDTLLPVPAARAERLLLVGIEGLRPRDYLPGPSGAPSMPFLAEMAREGIAVEALRPVAPATAYPSFTSAVTGRVPGRHGVVSDRVLGERGISRFGTGDVGRLRSPPLWFVARRAEREVAALGWPVTLGADLDALVPDAGPIPRDSTWLDVLRPVTTPHLLDVLLQATPRAVAGRPTAAERDRALSEVACRVLRQRSAPDLVLLRLIGVGATQRQEGPDSPAARKSLESVDRALLRLARCLEAAERLASTAWMVIGDGVYGPVHTRYDPNVALLRAGLIEADAESPVVATWQALVRSNGRSAYVYARDERQALEAR